MRSKSDLPRLAGLIEMTRDRNGVDIEYLNTLEAELDRAEIVNSKRIPANVINQSKETPS